MTATARVLVCKKGGMKAVVGYENHFGRGYPQFNAAFSCSDPDECESFLQLLTTPVLLTLSDKAGAAAHNA